MTSLIARGTDSDNPALQWLIHHSEAVKGEQRLLSQTLYCAGVVVNTKSESKAAEAAGLYRSLDGRGLQQHSVSPNVNGWVRDEGVALSGRNYIGAIGVRSATLHTADRSSRDARGNPSCEHCGAWDSLAHRLQVCSASWACA
jgi:hypothetical protein